ncbi:Rho GTPase activation protein [Pseudocohnilembus persalinus]|uniref:Rho GTPase activation protein n=1 Tax=Pseudocohnilembus persalinus TaxID=266149 RepID=A0A0V0QS58_PSEPJ|nr:Rho GTPase activation protein [Pseudocohnilembus persalinus]|eukprot:KRX04967.1 Rho GTPase activation protein [Pseudocohnilembus persalinus]
MERQKNRQTVADIYKNIDIHNQFKEIKNEENKQQGNMDRWYNRLFKKLTNKSQELISENQIISPKKKNAKFTSYKTFDKEEKKNQVVNKHIDQIQNHSHDNFVRDDFGINSTIQNQEEENDEIDNLSNKEQEELFVFVKYVKNRDEYDMDLETAFKIIKKVKIYVSKIEQLANNLIEKLVFNAQYFPRGQKILYALLRRQILNKFPQISTKHLNEIVTNLLIDKWLIPFSLDELQRNNAGNNKQIASDNFQIIWNLIKKVFKQEQFKDDYILEKLNPFIIKKQDTINKFFENIVNIDQNYISNLYLKFQEDLKQDQNMEGKQNSQLQDEQEDIDNYDQILNLFIGFQETQELMNLVEVNINLISKYKKNAQQEIQLIQRDLKNNKIFSDNQENFLWIFEPDSQQLGAYSDTMFKQQIKKDMSKEQIFATKFKNNMINFLQEIDNISNYIKLNQNIDLKIEDILFIIVSQLDIIHSALNDGKFINEVNEAICAYFEIVHEKLEQKFQNQPTSVIDSIYQLIEKFINRQIRNQDSFNGEPSLKDLQLQKLIQSYKFIDYKILEIEKFELEHDMWVSTANDLKKLWDYQSALEQLQFLSEIMKKVNSILRLSGYPSPGADDIQPLFIKIIILSNPPKLNTTLNMISSLLNMKKWSNEHFFYSYIMLKSSISYLQNLNNEKLGLELQQFQRLKEQSDNGDFDDL